ncbi:hypothetical protein SYNTR_0705 [Candidatus Syntrophocurvum alkaliphilum]|uniref:Uncharacterized protein n=1 Tax=Candidatus Syntrophocurvum alkaliphilum TaxID=2293317 RepID=A0A6I6D8H2_9FIRM|nr:hypothetical protein [Candidatus Syntrophocurvum alkaliphilum]QGT99298.1 hypothetical protein SYNTR_0705 [Candidatus Syntrophocurvum alkaliphilum]
MATKKQEIRLNNPSHVRRLLNRTINQLLNDEIEESKSRAIGYLSQILLKSMEVEDLAKRIEELEALVEVERGYTN